jgi:catechol 2,3-dioxygenase-like lactoylglutathione lyase family enzyme
VIDHVTIRVPDLTEGRAFYDLALSLAGWEEEPFEGFVKSVDADMSLPPCL